MLEELFPRKTAGHPSGSMGCDEISEFSVALGHTGVYLRKQPESQCSETRSAETRSFLSAPRMQRLGTKTKVSGQKQPRQQPAPRRALLQTRTPAGGCGVKAEHLPETGLVFWPLTTPVKPPTESTDDPKRS